MRFLLFGLLVLSFGASGDLEIHDSWSRATVPGMPMGAIYGRLHNKSESPIEVTNVMTTVARGAEIHESVEIEGMMRMREVTPFVIPAGESIHLEPGGKHIMLMGLRQALTQGEEIELTVTTDSGESVTSRVLIGGFGQMEMPEK